MATPGRPRPGNFAPGNNPNPNALANSMQNLDINQQQSSNFGGSGPRPSNAPPFGRQPPPPFHGSRPGPPGAFPRGPVPSSAPSPTPIAGPTRRAGPPPVAQLPPFASRPPPPGALPSSLARPVPPPSGTGPRPAPVPSPPFASHPLTPPQTGTGTSTSNGPPAFAPGMAQSGMRFPPAMGNMPKPSARPLQSPTMSPRSSPSSPHVHPSFVNPSASTSSSIGQPAPPFSGSLQAPPFAAMPQNMPPPPGSSPFSRPVPGMPQPSNSPFPMQAWPPWSQPGAPPPSQQQQPPQLYGMPPGAPPLSNQSMALGQTGQSKIDPNQIPRFAPSSTVILHATRQDNQANPPPPATSDYIVKDTGNCSPRNMRCTINQIPCTVDLLSTSAMQLALVVQPLALPHPSEEPIQVVDFGEHGPVRCSRCKGYINPFMKFIDQGRRFICNLCGFIDETPRDYHCNLGPDGRRRDADERPELCRGTVEFIATKEYMVYPKDSQYNWEDVLNTTRGLLGMRV